MRWVPCDNVMHDLPRVLGNMYACTGKMHRWKGHHRTRWSIAKTNSSQGLRHPRTSMNNARRTRKKKSKGATHLPEEEQQATDLASPYNEPARGTCNALAGIWRWKEPGRRILAMPPNTPTPHMESCQSSQRYIVDRASC
jgi:hypothetical protein